jgi:hypothetical protein
VLNTLALYVWIITALTHTFSFLIGDTETEGFEPSIRVSPYTRFPSERIQPLCHVSSIKIVPAMMLGQVVSPATGARALIHSKIRNVRISHAALCSLLRCLFGAIPFLLLAGFDLLLNSSHTEGEGFEPPVLLSTLVFKTSAFVRSANLPGRRDWGSDPGLRPHWAGVLRIKLPLTLLSPVALCIELHEDHTRDGIFTRNRLGDGR